MTSDSISVNPSSLSAPGSPRNCGRPSGSAGTMGLPLGISEEKRLELADWIAGVTGERPVAHEIARVPKDSNTKQGREFVALVRLVRLMIGKGILTEAEGTSVLHDPVL